MIIDTNHDTTHHVAALKAAGVKTIIRYLSPIAPGGEKCIKPAEARAIAGAGLRLGLVSEGWGDFAHGGISAGAGDRDGAFAAHVAPTLDAPDGACVYFAVDVDASLYQIRKLVVPYFRSVAAAFKEHAPKLRVGVYGSGAVCEAVIGAKLADLAWLSCSMGWTGSREFLASNKWALRQHLPQPVASIDADPDDPNGDIGDFEPFADIGRRRTEDGGQKTDEETPYPSSVVRPPSSEYAAVVAAVEKAIVAEIDVEVPAWARGMIPAGMVPRLAAASAKAAVDALDQYRAAVAMNRL